MNSIAANRREGESARDCLSMNASSLPFNRDMQQRRYWKAWAVAFSLAVLIHAAVWQIFRTMPTVEPPPEEPLIIEAALIVPTPAPPAAPAPVAAAPAPPQPKVQAPPPMPKPVPKVEKPAPKKVEKPKPKPVPKPRAEPEREEAEPAPRAPVQEAAPPPAPAAPTAPPASAGAPARADTPRPGRAASGNAENAEYRPGGMTGLKKRFPRAALERGWEGTVRLRVHILADGEIGEVIVAGSSGHDLLDETAVELIKEARATPARRGDKPVDSWVIVPYQFKIER